MKPNSKGGGQVTSAIYIIYCLCGDKLYDVAEYSICAYSNREAAQDHVARATKAFDDMTKKLEAIDYESAKWAEEKDAIIAANKYFPRFAVGRTVFDYCQMRVHSGVDDYLAGVTGQ